MHKGNIFSAHLLSVPVLSEFILCEQARISEEQEEVGEGRRVSSKSRRILMYFLKVTLLDFNKALIPKEQATFYFTVAFSSFTTFR